MSGEPGQICVAGRWVWPVAWTPALIAELTRLWNNEKFSALAIAIELGITRNAVIGKARRLGLESRPHPINGRVAMTPEERRAKHTEGQKRRRGNGNALTHRLSDARALAGMPKADRSNYLPRRAPYRPLPMSVTHKHCQWIASEPTGDDSCKCMEPSEAGPYCGKHAAMAWAPRHPKTAAPVAA